MRSIFIILPHQLYEKNAYLQHMDKIYIVEDPYYWNPTYHKQKLCMHRASMQYYYAYVSKYHPKKVEYITYDSCSYDFFRSMKNTKIHMFHPIDRKSEANWKTECTLFYDPPNFITTMSQLEEYKTQYGNRKRYTHTHFYQWQRRRLGILLDAVGNPLFERWSFDIDNRKKFSRSYQEPNVFLFRNAYIDEAKSYIHKHFPHAFGELKDVYYPVTHVECKRHIKRFIQTKLTTFGETQDAISKNVVYGQHSILSSSLNIGLITPTYVLQQVIIAFQKSKEKKKIIASVEGFIRQIIGWREYMRFVYLFQYREILDLSYMPFSHTMPRSWYTGTTELEILNYCIQKVRKYAYLHHIERLMIMNNIAVLYEIQYKYVYKWFMRCFIDSYDWVMVPNVVMNYNAVSSSPFMTRVYLGSDHYLKKMSDFKNKDDFKRIHELYWRFLKKYKKVLAKDYGVASQLKRITI